MPIVLWTQQAEDDLERILFYVCRDQHSPKSAGKIVREIAQKAVAYAAQPFLGDVRPEFGSTVRAFYIHRYVALYRPTTNGIEMLRVIHGARDVFRVFRLREP